MRTKVRARKNRMSATHSSGSCSGAGNESRTRDLNLGKVALYQLSYSRFDDRAQILASFAPHRNTSLQLFYYWRRDSESNRGTRLCRPLHNHSAIAPQPFRPAAPMPRGHLAGHCPACEFFGAGNESRTRDLNLGKVALYQLSYSRPGKTAIIDTILSSSTPICAFSRSASFFRLAQQRHRAPEIVPHRP